MTLLSVRGVVKSFPGVRALRGVSFDVAAGEIHALVGENGAGKSTLIKVLGGAVVPDAGEVLLDGRRLGTGDPLAAARAGIRVIWQELSLVPGLTVAENLWLGRERGGWWLSRREMTERAQRALDDLGAGISAAATTGTLSVAQQQLVEIARAMLDDERGAAARVLVLDEPTSSLPGADAARLLARVKALAARGVGIIYISHRLEEVFEIADRITVLRDGEVTGTTAARDIDRRGLVRLMVGRDLADEFPARRRSAGDVVLEAAGLSAPPRFAHADIVVRRGEIVGLTGLVGAGRTSVGLALSGALRAAGRIRLGGRDVAFRSPREALDAGVALIPEDRKAEGIFPLLGVRENTTISSLARFVRLGLIDSAGERTAAEGAIRDFAVRCAGLGQPAGTLSGGNQQKLLLARALLEERRVVILDEPTRGVDVGAKSEIYGLIARLTERGLGVLMISSELPELLGMADRIVVMREGRTVGEVARADATEVRIMELATATTAAPGAAA